MRPPMLEGAQPKRNVPTKPGEKKSAPNEYFACRPSRPICHRSHISPWSWVGFCIAHQPVIQARARARPCFVIRMRLPGRKKSVFAAAGAIHAHVFMADSCRSPSQIMRTTTKRVKIRAHHISIARLAILVM